MMRRNPRVWAETLCGEQAARSQWERARGRAAVDVLRYYWIDHWICLETLSWTPCPFRACMRDNIATRDCIWEG